MKDEIIAVLDRSGSMHGYEQDTIGGYNSFIKEQLALSENAAVTLILFDDKYEVIYEGVPISEVDPLTARTYTVRGGTALRDAVAKATMGAVTRFKSNIQKPNKVVVYIATDGMENASREYSASQLKEIVKTQEDTWGWEYLYIGCDHDVITAARDLGIKSVNTINFSKNNTQDSYGAASAMMSSYRSSGVSLSTEELDGLKASLTSK